MAASYDVEKLFIARNRLRMELRDTNIDAPRFQDEELDRVLAETATKHFVWVYHDGTTGNPSEATIKVQAGTSDMELVLARTTAPPESANTFALRDLKYDTLEELFLAVQALGKGWQIGLDTGGTIWWIFEHPDDQPTNAEARGLLRRSPADLAVLAQTSVLGYSNMQRISMYNLDTAITRARRLDDDGLTTLDSYSEGDISWSKKRGGDTGKRKPTRRIAYPIY